MEYGHQVRLETYYAVNRALGETFIVYNPDFQKLEILKAETTMADGRKVAAPANAFNEVLPYAAHGFADFSGLREMVVTHTGLERGAVVDLRYRIHTKPGFFPGFAGREILARDFPVEAYSLTLIVPAGQELRYRVFGPKIEAEVSANGAEKRYTFALADVPAAAHEPLAPVQAAAFVVFSSVADWGQALALADDGSKLPAALVEKIKKLRIQNPDRTDLLAALQKVAASEVQNCNLEPEMMGWHSRPLGRVAQSNYGTKLEKALLLQGMLKEAGVFSQLLAVAAGTNFAEDVPSALQMGEYWLKASENGLPDAYLDPGHEQQEFFPYRSHGLAAFNMEKKALENLPAQNWEQNRLEISGTVALEPAGASGTLMVNASGIFNRYMDAVEDNGKFIEGLLKKVFPIQKIEITKLLMLTRHEIRVEATFNGPWLKDAGAGFFTVDHCRLPGLSENMVQQTKRDAPLLLDAPFKVILKLDLQPAANLNLEYLAPEVLLSNEAGSFQRKQSRIKNGPIQFYTSCHFEKASLVPELYPRLRELLQAYFTPGYWLVFKKGN
ncbi:MAG TPA: DUF3857 domain-containing protein [Acidobacteriota bacterium]